MQIEGCKHELEFTIPVEEIGRETERVVGELQKKVRLPGFRPGKAPASLVRSRFAAEVRQDVLEGLIPKALQKRFQEEHLEVVGTPNVKDIHFHDGEPLRFKAEFEVAPVIELGEYRGLTVKYEEPQVTDEDVAKRLEELREQKAEYVNLEPRPAADGDYALVHLRSLEGAAEAVEQDDLTLHVGDPETLPEFSEALRGMSPEEVKEFEITYPEDYGQRKLAGRTVRFAMRLKALRRKELPELNDDFAKDLGDFQNLEELKEAVRKGIFGERERRAQEAAKHSLIETLVAAHPFPVPEAYVDRQVEMNVENQLRGLAARGMLDPKMKIDWAKAKASQKEQAEKDVRASLLLDKIAEKEAIYATNEELDREVQRIARQEREPVAAVRKKLEKDGTLRRIASHIRTEKTLNFLFEQARKEAV
jgi:trigger factor